MVPKYSILLCNQSIEAYTYEIDKWLHAGIKVFWFGREAEAAELKRTHKPFADAFFLQAFGTKLTGSDIIVDGDDRNHIINKLESDCPSFNAAQYLVEHCKAEEHIIVQASAGTGKTTVMIDRIMFLIHTVPDLHMSDMYMITFTNDAANQMNMRLQDMLMLRYRLTGQQKYFRWVEEQSQMNISTIHSFAYDMLKGYGIGQSFTENLELRSFVYERNELIYDVIDRKMNEHQSISAQAGVPLHKAKELVSKFWKNFSTLGVPHADMLKMDWGNAADNRSVPFQQLMKSVVEPLDDDYFEIKRKNDAIALNDIMRDLQEVLMGDDAPVADFTMKYLFIDEFQDSDLSQIMVAAQLVRILGAYLFVVGDVKQSIYRFRGANDKAFEVLLQDLQLVHAKQPRQFVLVNNYRTASPIMNRMDQYFQVWGRMGFLKYDKPVRPFNKMDGSMRMVAVNSLKDLESDIVHVTCDALEDLIARVQASGKEPTEKNRVVLLTRTNKQLDNLLQLMRRNGIPVTVRREGSFFSSEAVRDFFAMICSYIYADEPKYIFNYLLTPYAGEIEPMDINQMERLDGEQDKLVEYLSHYLKQTSWEKYYKAFRLRPVMSVIKDILDEVSVVDYYIMNAKRRRVDENWNDTRILADTKKRATQYQANLEKLLELLQNNLGREKVSLYDVYQFLKLSIATNRDESEPNVERADDYQSVLCMTVHKSKGLEFDTVIIPYTNKKFPSQERTEILIDPMSGKVGWNFEGGKRYSPMQNDLYFELKEEENLRTREEETRMLYVAMTRAIRNLICIVPAVRNYSWAYLIREAEIDYE